MYMYSYVDFHVNVFGSTHYCGHMVNANVAMLLFEYNITVKRIRGLHCGIHRQVVHMQVSTL